MDSIYELNIHVIYLENGVKSIVSNDLSVVKCIWLTLNVINDL